MFWGSLANSECLCMCMRCMSNACAPNVGQYINKNSKVQSKYYRKKKKPSTCKIVLLHSTVQSTSLSVDLIFLTVISANTWSAFVLLKSTSRDYVKWKWWILKLPERIEQHLCTVAIGLHTEFQLGARGHNIITLPFWNLSDTTCWNTTTDRVLKKKHECVSLLDRHCLQKGSVPS